MLVLIGGPHIFYKYIFDLVRSKGCALDSTAPF